MKGLNNVVRPSEQQLENILAAYPDEFFPHRQFRLVGRQTSFVGVGRFDLLFEDGASRKWLVELKAVPLKITDTDQLMGYHEALQRRAPGESFIPCFVAPTIAPHVRSYLDGKAIEYREITLAEFERVALAHGVTLERNANGQSPPTIPVPQRSQIVRKAPPAVGNAEAAPSTGPLGRSATVTGVPFEYSGSLTEGLVVNFPRSKSHMRITPETIDIIRREISRRSPVLMGANRKPLVRDSVGETLLLDHRVTPQAMSYVLPLLVEEGFCTVSERRPFTIRKT